MSTQLHISQFREQYGRLTNMTIPRNVTESNNWSVLSFVLYFVKSLSDGMNMFRSLLSAFSIRVQASGLVK